MAYVPNRDDPTLIDPIAPSDQIRRDVPLDQELQADPELAEGRASGTRVALYAVAALVILGAVFYGLTSNNTSDTASRNAPSATTADSGTLPPPPGIRDVTPRGSNAQPGVTTGSAPARPDTPPSSPNAGSNSGTTAPR
jgi:hypothetical protein